MLNERIDRLIYEIRWWHWWLFTGRWPVETLYGEDYELDKESRDVIISRVETEKEKNEPMFRGTRPNRRTGNGLG